MLSTLNLRSKHRFVSQSVSIPPSGLMCRDLKDPMCKIISMFDQIPHVIIERSYFQNIRIKFKFNLKIIWQYTDISIEQEFRNKTSYVCRVKEFREILKTKLCRIV